MVMTFQCECGNRTAMYATGFEDEQGREIIEPEDDDRLAYIVGEHGVLFRCGFCGHTYRLEKLLPENHS